VTGSSWRLWGLVGFGKAARKWSWRVWWARGARETWLLLEIKKKK